MQDEQVVDVAPDDETFAGLLSAEGENTRIRGALREAVFQKPGKKRSLPSPARLGHAVNGLFHSANAGTAVCAQGSVPRGRVAIDHLAGLQLPLQVSRDEVQTTHSHALRRLTRGRGARSGASWRRTFGRNRHRASGHNLARIDAP
eukprot:5894774-Pleurochrysis_carterae.AAC.1